MFFVECVISNKNNITIKYQSNIVPRIGETLISDDRVFKIINVTYYTRNKNTVTLVVEEI